MARKYLGTSRLDVAGYRRILNPKYEDRYNAKLEQKACSY